MLCGNSLECQRQELYEDLLLFAGFATVGDVMDLTGENRILVKEALKLLKTTSHPGISALIEVNEISRETISAFHIGFVLGTMYQCKRTAGYGKAGAGAFKDYRL